MVPARVVFVVLDAFPNGMVSAELTPVLYALSIEGGRNRHGGLGDLTAATYPNHASFVTGVRPTVHGIMTNDVLREGRWVPSHSTGPLAPTLFDDCRRAGRSSAAIVGDQYLIGVCGAAVADTHWPPKGLLAPDAPRGLLGYAADRAVIEAAASTDLGVDLLFVQLDEVDSVRHVHGASSDDAIEQCRATDAALGSLLELVRGRWAETVVCVVSDHDQEDLSPEIPVDLAPHLEGGVTCRNQGTAALVVGETSDAALLAIDGVCGVAAFDPRHRVVWGAPGRGFGSAPSLLRAEHGSPRTRTQLAVVAGGHPAVGELARRVEARRPEPSDWAGWVRDLLGIDADIDRHTVAT